MGNPFNQIISDLTPYNPNKGTWDAPGVLGGHKVEAGTPGETQESAQARYQEQERQRKLAELRKQQSDYANQLLTPQSLDEAFNPYRREVLSDLADSQKTLASNLSKRGLAYGGVAKGAGDKLKGLAKQDLASGRLKIEKDAQSESQRIKDNLMNEGFQIQNTMQQTLDNIYQQAMDQYVQRRRALKQAGQTVGSIAGAYFGGPAGAYAGGQVGGSIAE